MLEKLIAENTEAMRQLTLAVQAMAEAANAEGLTEMEQRADEEAAASRAKAKKTKAKKAEPETELTLADVRAALQKLGRDKALPILQKYHAEKLPELHQDYYQRVFEEATEAAA